MSDPSPPDPRLTGDPLAPIPHDALPTAEQPRLGRRERIARTRIDTRPLRTSRDFRLLFFGGSVSFFGSMVTYVAVPFQVYELTGSTVAVGMLGVAELLPLIGFGLWGGALADAVDRRRMVLATELGMTLLSGLLLLNAVLPDARVWPVFLVAAAIASLDGLQRPSLDALIPRIVDHDQLAAASALSSLRMNIGMIAGPAIGGVLVASAGVSWAYGVDVVTFGASLVAIALMRRSPPPASATKPSVSGIVVGLRYAMSGAGAARHLRRRHGGHAFRDADGFVSSHGKGRLRPALGARTSLLGGLGRLVDRDVDKWLDESRSPSRKGRCIRRHSVGSRDCGLRAVRQHLARIRVPRGRRSR